MTGKHPKRLAREGVDPYGRTPLHNAVIAHDLDAVHGLLREGANVDAQDDNGWTPLHFAAQDRLAEIVSALLASGADPSLADSFGNTALWRAVFCSEGDGRVIRLLREAGASPLQENKSGVSPVKLARTIGNYDVAQFFSDIIAKP